MSQVTIVTDQSNLMFSTCSYQWRQHQPTWRRWQWRLWRPRRCWKKIIYGFHFKQGPPDDRSSIPISFEDASSEDDRPDTPRVRQCPGSYQSYNKGSTLKYLLGGHVDFWSFETDFLCHFLYFRFNNLLKIWLKIGHIYIHHCI